MDAGDFILGLGIILVGSASDRSSSALASRSHAFTHGEKG